MLQLNVKLSRTITTNFPLASFDSDFLEAEHARWLCLVAASLNFGGDRLQWHIQQRKSANERAGSIDATFVTGARVYSA
jgi:hypothetical protein